MVDNDSISFVSSNARGLASPEKRQDIFNYYKSKKFKFVCIQDTHFTTEKESIIKNQTDFDCYFNCYKSNSRGVCILINKNFEYKVFEQYKDDQGNFLALNVKIENTNLTLITLYGPNKDSPSFFKNITDAIEKFNNTNVIICGDFNLTLDQNNDTFNYKHINNPNARERLLEIMHQHELVDCFRSMHPDTKRYTWRKKTPIQQARLDFFLVSNSLLNLITKSSIEASYRSDHSPISLELKLQNFNQGKGTWKFNSSLLGDPNYISIIKEIIKDTKIRYAIPVYDLDYIKKSFNQDFELTVDDRTFLDILLMEIRGKTISYSSYLKKEQNNLEKKLSEEIYKLESGKPNNENTKILEEKQLELRKIRHKKMRGHFIRSRAIDIEYSEKPTKYFCGLESKNFTNKTINKLEKSDGTIIDKQEHILHEVKQFYESLYTEKNSDNNISLENILSTFNVAKVTDLDQTKISGPLTENEILISLKRMSNGKSPGSDGFSVDFVKFFWNDIKTFITKSLNKAY